MNYRVTKEECALIDAGARYVKEYQRWGYCPTYKMPDGTLRFVETFNVGDDRETQTAVTKVLTGPQMYAYLRQNWRPQSREDQDWFVVNVPLIKEA